MTSFWCFSINGFRAWFAEVDVFFCMKPFYSTNHVLSVQGSATASLHLPYSSCSSNQRASTNSVAALPRCALCGNQRLYSNSGGPHFLAGTVDAQAAIFQSRTMTTKCAAL